MIMMAVMAVGMILIAARLDLFQALREIQVRCVVLKQPYAEYLLDLVMFAAREDHREAFCIGRYRRFTARSGGLTQASE